MNSRLTAVAVILTSVVALTPSALATLGLAKGRRGRVVPNPVMPVPPRSAAPEDPPLIVALGRLVPQKGFDMLLDAFAGLARRHDRVRLEVWGEGPDRAALEAQRDALGLAGRAVFPGTTQAPYELLRRATLPERSARADPRRARRPAHPTRRCRVPGCRHGAAAD